MTFQDGVAYSRNVVAAKVALGLGKTTRESAAILYDMWTRLGYGQPTGIDVAGEVSGIAHDPGIIPWREIDLANGAFGQGVAVTPIQLATAYAALVNGGTLVQPHVVKAVGDRDVEVVAARSSDRRQAVANPPRDDAATSSRRCRSTATARSCPATTSGGKTGTAQIWDPRPTTATGPGRSTSSTTRSSATSAGRPGSRT